MRFNYFYDIFHFLIWNSHLSVNNSLHGSSILLLPMIFGDSLNVTPVPLFVTDFNLWSSEAVAQRCSVKKVFLKVLQNSQENTCARVSDTKKRLWHRCFPVNFAKHVSLQNTSDDYFWKLWIRLHCYVE